MALALLLTRSTECHPLVESNVSPKFCRLSDDNACTVVDK